LNILGFGMEFWKWWLRPLVDFIVHFDYNILGSGFFEDDIDFFASKDYY